MPFIHRNPSVSAVAFPLEQHYAPYNRTVTKQDKIYSSMPSVAARARFGKGCMRTPETPGNMAALMTLSQVTTPNTSRKVSNVRTGHYEVTVRVDIGVLHITTLLSW